MDKSAAFYFSPDHIFGTEDRTLATQIVRNGSAERPLPEGFMPLPGFAVAADGAVAELEGTLMADLAGLPIEWPPE